MNLLLTDDIVIWLPIHELNNPALAMPNYLIFTLVYLLLQSVSAYFTLILVTTSWRVRKFHKNMTICFSFIFGAWFECWLGIVLVWPYKCGLVTIDESQEKFSNFELSDRSKMPRITNYTSAPFLFLGSFLIWHYLVSTVSAMCNFVIERAIASFFFSDYEKRERSYIGFSLLICSQLIVFQVSALLFFHYLNLKSTLLISIILLTGVVVTFFFLLHYNTSLRNQLDITTQITVSYNLAARFQAAENARSLRLAIFVFAVICCIFTVALTMLIVLLLRLVPEHNDYLITTAFECLVSLNPLFVVPAAMFSVPEWKDAFYNHIPFAGKRTTTSERARRRRRPLREEEEKAFQATRANIETHLYFVQLEDSWNVVAPQ